MAQKLKKPFLLKVLEKFILHPSMALDNQVVKIAVSFFVS
jgi:hypothetical protein